jgi:hypothetical protein
MSDTRHRQLSRIYNRTIEDDGDARAAISGDPGILASALFDEAARSDDVTSLASARAYAEDRLAFFGNLAAENGDAVRTAFAARFEKWAR